MKWGEEMKCLIGELRTDQNMTQAQLAAACGISQQAVSKIETGSGEPSYSLAMRIAHALGCTIDELYADEPEKEAG